MGIPMAIRMAIHNGIFKGYRLCRRPLKIKFLVLADGGKWMCPTARSRRDIHNEHVKTQK